MRNLLQWYEYHTGVLILLFIHDTNHIWVFLYIHHHVSARQLSESTSNKNTLCSVFESCFPIFGTTHFSRFTKVYLSSNIFKRRFFYCYRFLVSSDCKRLRGGFYSYFQSEFIVNCSNTVAHASFHSTKFSLYGYYISLIWERQDWIISPNIVSLDNVYATSPEYLLRVAYRGKNN